MKEINLLPEDYLQQLEIKKLIKVMAACAAIIFLLLILIVVALELADRFAEKKLSQYETLSSDIKYVESDETYREILRREERGRSGEIILSAVKTGDYIVADEVASILGEAPSGVYALSVSVDNTSREIIFEGVTQDRELIVEYFERLNALRIFKNASISKNSTVGHTAQHGTSNGLTEFSIELSVGE